MELHAETPSQFLKKKAHIELNHDHFLLFRNGDALQLKFVTYKADKVNGLDVIKVLCKSYRRLTKGRIQPWQTPPNNGLVCFATLSKNGVSYSFHSSHPSEYQNSEPPALPIIRDFQRTR